MLSGLRFRAHEMLPPGSLNSREKAQKAQQKRKPPDSKSAESLLCLLCLFAAKAFLPSAHPLNGGQRTWRAGRARGGESQKFSNGLRPEIHQREWAASGTRQ